MCFFKRFRSFNAKNLGSVGQRAAKLLAVKVGGLKKGLPAGPGPTMQIIAEKRGLNYYTSKDNFYSIKIKLETLVIRAKIRLKAQF